MPSDRPTPQKRQCTEGAAAAAVPIPASDAPDFATKDDVAEMLAALLATTKSATSESIAGMEERFNSGMATLVQKLEAKHSARCENIEKELSSVKDSQQKVEEEQAGVRAELGRLQEVLAIAERRAPDDPPQKIDYDSFTRKVDQAVLKVNSLHPVGLDALKSATRPIWVNAGVEDQRVQIEGPPLGKAFTIRFIGDRDTAERRCRKAFQGLRSKDGTWSKYSVKTPTDEEVPLFVSTDKNPKQQAEEAVAKKLSKIIKAEFPAYDVNMVRRDVAVYVQWVPSVRVVVEPGSNKLLWNQAGLDTLEINRATITEKFNSTSGPASISSVEWSV